LGFIADEPQPVRPIAASAVLTHHWLVRRRGGEKVLEALAELLPAAPIYTLVHDRAGMRRSPLAQREIHGSWLQKVPGAARHYPKLLQLMPAAARAIKLPRAELVVCSDAAVAKAMTPHASSVVVCYCHSPMRYVYEPEIEAEYARSLPTVFRPYWRWVIRRVRAADQRAAKRVDVFVANSQHVARRIERCYGRRAAVVYPPVDVPVQPPAPHPREDFYLCVGHHVPYKRLDLAITACRALGRRLVVIGDVPNLVARADLRAAFTQAPRESAVELLGWQPDAVVLDHYRRARGLLFPGEEDFGIIPVEAMAHGCPVIAYGVGGAAETVVNGETGVLFEPQTTAALVAAMQTAERARFDAAVLHRQALRFSRARFMREMRVVLLSALDRDSRAMSD
jgi:glycosyltransferase involved in cell wall biosynthesis